MSEQSCRNAVIRADQPGRSSRLIRLSISSRLLEPEVSLTAMATPLRRSAPREPGPATEKSGCRMDGSAPGHEPRPAGRERGRGFGGGTPCGMLAPGKTALVRAAGYPGRRTTGCGQLHLHPHYLLVCGRQLGTDLHEQTQRQIGLLQGDHRAVNILFL